MSAPQYFAQIDNANIVIYVAVVTAEFMAENPERYPGTWVETFVNLPNKNFAGIGDTYDYPTDNFYPPADETPIS
jgi:hypothetical protein